MTTPPHDHRVTVEPGHLRRANHGQRGGVAANADRDKHFHYDTGLYREADDHRSLTELGRQAEGQMESELTVVSLDKETEEDLGASDGNEFVIHLGRFDDGWIASCTLVARPRISRTATRGTPAQALAEITRAINRFLYGQARHRPDSEDAGRMAPPTSTSTDEG